jgi:tetratricopeptide (TPR) repeat protein
LLTIFQKVCDAVAFAHSKGVIHRDLKPENIMIGDFGEVLVMDWGLAKVVRGQRSEGRDQKSENDALTSDLRPLTSGLTMAGRVVGSPHYMAPEQAEGENERVDARADVFALGGILYCILSLHPPFIGASLDEVLEKCREGRVPPPASHVPRSGLPHCPGGKIPASLSAVAMKALSLHPGDRYQAIKELQRDVEAYQGGFATSAEQAGALKLLVLFVKRHPAKAGLVLASVLLIVSLITGLMMKVILSERQALANVARMGETAPAFHSQAAVLVEEARFDDALEMATHATTLAPQVAEYHALKGNILESLLRTADARDAYTLALRYNKTNEVAATNLKLCLAILTDNPTGEKPRPASLQQLQAGMLEQGRFAEAVAMLHHLGGDKQREQNTWKTILNRLGIAGEGRLIVDDRGMFQLDLSKTAVDNISFLRGMPLRVLNLTDTKVNNLSPLQGTPLTTLQLARTEVSDLGPLKGMPLTKLELSHTKVSDLGPLQGMPLTDLGLRNTLVTDLSPLTQLPLTGLSLANTPVSDLTPLAGMPLKWLELSNTKVSDLNPLRGMPLKWIELSGTKVTDLSPLRGMTLGELNLSGCRRVGDLTPLRGMPLRELRCEGCSRLRDISPLVDCKQLAKLLIPAQCENIEVLRALPGLKFLGTQWDNWQTTATEFWKQYDAQRR